MAMSLVGLYKKNRSFVLLVDLFSTHHRVASDLSEEDRYQSSLSLGGILMLAHYTARLSPSPPAGY
jgi:hypothetical protein